MRKLFSFIAAGMLVLGAASQANAALVPYQGVIGLQILTLVGSGLGGGTALVNGSGGGGHLTLLQVAGSSVGTVGLSLPVTDPAAAPVGGIALTATNGSGTFTSGAGFMAMAGVAKVCLFGPCSAAAANISVPLSNIGVDGSTTASLFVNVTVTGNPWAAGSIPFGTTTTSGFAHGPASLTSSTVSGSSGVKRYVTPIFISTNIPASAIVPAFAFFDLHFGIPEPGTLVLLGSGMAGLVMVGRSRARKS